MPRRESTVPGISEPGHRVTEDEAARPIAGYAELELDLRDALLKELESTLAHVDAAALTPENIGLLPDAAQGVYMLLLDAQPTYIGKTDARHGFRDRLRRHFDSLSSRLNLNLAAVSFKAIRVMVFTTLNVEDELIRRYVPDSDMA